MDAKPRKPHESNAHAGRIHGGCNYYGRCIDGIAVVKKL